MSSFVRRKKCLPNVYKPVRWTGRAAVGLLKGQDEMKFKTAYPQQCHKNRADDAFEHHSGYICYEIKGWGGERYICVTRWYEKCIGLATTSEETKTRDDAAKGSPEGSAASDGLWVGYVPYTHTYIRI